MTIIVLYVFKKQ